MVAQSEICLSHATKTLSFRVVALMQPFSGNRVDLLSEWAPINSLNNRLWKGGEGALYSSSCQTDSSTSPCVSLQRLCVLQCFAMAQIRTVSVWASVRTSARSLATKWNTGPFPFSLGTVLWAFVKGISKENHLKYLSSRISPQGPTKYSEVFWTIN